MMAASPSERERSSEGVFPHATNESVSLTSTVRPSEDSDREEQASGWIERRARGGEIGGDVDAVELAAPGDARRAPERADRRLLWEERPECGADERAKLPLPSSLQGNGVMRMSAEEGLMRKRSGPRGATNPEASDECDAVPDDRNRDRDLDVDADRGDDSDDDDEADDDIVPS